MWRTSPFRGQKTAGKFKLWLVRELVFFRAICNVYFSSLQTCCFKSLETNLEELVLTCNSKRYCRQDMHSSQKQRTKRAPWQNLEWRRCDGIPQKMAPKRWNTCKTQNVCKIKIWGARFASFSKMKRYYGIVKMFGKYRLFGTMLEMKDRIQTCC